MKISKGRVYRPKGSKHDLVLLLKRSLCGAEWNVFCLVREEWYLPKWKINTTDLLNHYEELR